MGESDPIEHPDPDLADAVGVSSDEVEGRPRLALIAAVAPTPTAGSGALPSEQLQRLADRTAAALVLPVPAVDHERELPAEALARVLDAIEASTAAATKKAYRSDWDRFAGWAGSRRFPPLPVAPAVLAHYVTEAAAEQTGVGTWRYAPATLTRWVASINQVHTAAGLDAPGRSEVVRRALSGIRRIRATPQNRRAPWPGSPRSSPPRTPRTRSRTPCPARRDT